MNGKNALHLALTEARRNLWFILVFWLLVVFLPSLEIILILAGLLTACIAHSDHLTRTTAHWKVRPAAFSDSKTASAGRSRSALIPSGA